MRETINDLIFVRCLYLVRGNNLILHLVRLDSKKYFLSLSIKLKEGAINNLMFDQAGLKGPCAFIRILRAILSKTSLIKQSVG